MLVEASLSTEMTWVPSGENATPYTLLVAATASVRDTVHVLTLKMLMLPVSPTASIVPSGEKARTPLPEPVSTWPSGTRVPLLMLTFQTLVRPSVPLVTARPAFTGEKAAP